MSSNRRTMSYSSVSRVSRSSYLTMAQRAKLIRLVYKDTELFEAKFSPSFTHKEAQLRWQAIAAKLNAIPGARKGWSGWRRSWQDIKSKLKKKSLSQYSLTCPEDEMILSTISENSISDPKDIKESFVCAEESSITSSKDLKYEDGVAETPKIYITNIIKEPEIMYMDNVTEPTTSKTPNNNVNKNAKTYRQRRLQNTINMSKSLDLKMKKEKLTLKTDYLQIKKQYYEESLAIKREKNLLKKKQISVLQDILTSINRFSANLNLNQFI